MLKYKDLTTSEIRRLCNGCGKKGSFIKPPDWFFKASCNHHDFMYWRGCTKTDRKLADKAFYRSMCRDVKARGKWWNKAFMYTQAYTYYRAVRIFGGNPSLGGFHYAGRMRGRKELNKLIGR